MRMQPEDYTAIVDATIAQIHDLASRLSAIIAKDNKMRAAGSAGKLGPRNLTNINSLLSIPLKEQIGSNDSGGDHA
jgi:hypothetical protein